MKRNLALMLSFALAVSVFAGCTKRPASTPPEVSSIPPISVPPISVPEISEPESSAPESSSIPPISSSTPPASSSKPVASSSKPASSSSKPASSSTPVAPKPVTPVLINEGGTFSNRSVVNLTITEDAEEDEIILDGVTVTGTLTVNGGATLILRNSTIEELVVDRYGLTYEIFADGKTNVAKTKVMSNVKLDEYELSSGYKGFHDLSTAENQYLYFIDVQLEDAKLNTVTLTTRTQLTDDGEDLVNKLVNKNHLYTYEPSYGGGGGSSSSYSSITINSSATHKNKTYKDVTVIPSQQNGTVSVTLDNVNIKGTLLIKGNGKNRIDINTQNGGSIAALTVHSSVANGEVYLNGVKVTGTTTIQGGGASSINLVGATVKNVTVNKVLDAGMETPRVVFNNTTPSGVVTLANGATIVKAGGTDKFAVVVTAQTTGKEFVIDAPLTTLTVNNNITNGANIQINAGVDAITLNSETNLILNGAATVVGTITNNTGLADAGTITLNNSARVTTVNAGAATIIVNSGTQIDTLNLKKSSTANVKGIVHNLNLESTATGSAVTISNGANVNIANVNAQANVTVKDTSTAVGTLTIGKSIANAPTVKVDAGASIGTLTTNSTAAIGVAGTGSKIETINVGTGITTPPTVTVQAGATVDKLNAASDTTVTGKENITSTETSNGAVITDGTNDIPSNVVSISTTTELEKAINSLQNNQTIILTATSYQLTKPIVIDGKSGVIIKANTAATLVPQGGSGNTIEVNGSALTLEGITTVGSIKLEKNGNTKAALTLNGTNSIPKIYSTTHKVANGEIDSSVDGVTLTATGYTGGWMLNDNKYEYVWVSNVSTPGFTPESKLITTVGEFSKLSSAGVNDTIYILRGTYNLTAPLSFSNLKNVTVSPFGSGATPVIISGSSASAIENLVTFISSNVTLQGITIEQAKKSGLHAYLSTVNLNNVVLQNNGGAGLLVNGSTVTANGLTTTGNAWGGVNVDKGKDVNATANPTVFTLKADNNTTNNLAEMIPIYSDNYRIDANGNTVTVNVPSTWVQGKLNVTAPTPFVKYAWLSTDPGAEEQTQGEYKFTFQKENP